MLQCVLEINGSLEREVGQRDMNHVVHVSEDDQSIAAAFRSIQYDHRPCVC